MSQAEFAPRSNIQLVLVRYENRHRRVHFELPETALALGRRPADRLAEEADLPVVEWILPHRPPLTTKGPTMGAPVTRILVGIDASPAAQRALHWAAGLAVATGASVDVVFAWWPDQSELPPPIADREHERAHTQVTDWCRPLREAGVTHQGRPIEGEARHVLAREVERTRPDLAVIGARRSESGVALGLGAVTHHLTHPLRVPLAVVPGTDFGTGPLVAGIDGSNANLAALRWAAALALQLARPIEAVCASYPRFPKGGLDPAGWRWGDEDDVHAEVEKVRAEHGHVPLLFVADEDPRSAVEQIASRDHAEAIIVGSRGWGGLHGLMLGKVTHELLRHSNRPVIVVPHDHEVRFGREAESGDIRLSS